MCHHHMSLNVFLLVQESAADAEILDFVCMCITAFDALQLRQTSIMQMKNHTNGFQNMMYLALHSIPVQCFSVIVEGGGG